MGHQIPDSDLAIFCCTDEIQLPRLEEYAQHDPTADNSKLSELLLCEISNHRSV